MEENKNERGAIIVEATISLSAFMFAVFMFLSVANICFSQAKMQIAINTTAREISQYMYLYGLSGLNQAQAELHKGGEAARATIRTVSEGVSIIGNSAAEIQGSMENAMTNTDKIGEMYEQISQEIDKGSSAVQSIQAELEKLAEDPGTFILGCAQLFADGTIEVAKSRLIAAPLAKALVKKHLAAYEGQSEEEFLRWIGIVPGGNGTYLDGLDFSESLLCPGGEEEIKITVKYQIRVLDFFHLDLRMNFEQTASTTPWMAGSLW